MATEAVERMHEFNEASPGLNWRKKVIAIGTILHNQKGHTLLHVDAGCFHDEIMAMVVSSRIAVEVLFFQQLKNISQP